MTHPAQPPPPEAASGSYDRPNDRWTRGRLVGLALALIAELAIIALLLTVGWSVAGDKGEAPQVVALVASRVADEPPPDEQSAPEQAPSEARPEVTSPDPPPPETVPDEQVPLPIEPAPPKPVTAAIARPETPPAPPSKPPAPGKPARTYGPPDTGPPSSQFDSRRVGTAPNGEPMYAARWYREPTRQELAGYLSTATAPSTALLVCRTVPDFRVEDCELLGETPPGSMIGRAVMAATWQFRVRPAIIGGRSQVGSWVRIRIDYSQSIQR